jgi:hypothetical protein
MKKYTPILVEGTDDQYKIYTDNRGTMLCGDQLDDEYVKLTQVWDLIERSKGDLEFVKSKLPKSSILHD